MAVRDRFIVLAAIALVTVATAVALVSEAAVAPRLPAIGGTHTEGIVVGFRSLNPHLATTQADRDVAAVLFTGLMRFDQQGGVARDLAESVRMEDEGRAWVFRIRDDARWHDGTPVTADDVLYTAAVTQDRGYAGPLLYASGLRGAKVERVDARTVRFVLPDVYAPFAEVTTMPLLPAHLVGSVRASELAADPFNLRPVGTGPFVFESREEHRVVLAANEDFYRLGAERARPYVDRLVFRAYQTAEEALEALARGEVQGLGGLSPADAARARQLKGIALHRVPSSEYTVLKFNLSPDRSTLLDRRVRQAIALAIDRGRLLRMAVDGQGVVAQQPVPAGSWAFAQDARRHPYDPAGARALLEEAGWTDADLDGIRERGEERLRFTIVTSDEPIRLATARQIARDLHAVGIEVDVEAVPWQQLIDERARERQFDAILLSIVGGSDPDPYAFWHSSQASDPGYNFSGYSTLPMDKALEDARRTLDQAERRVLYAQIFTQLAEDVPAVFLYFADYLFALDREVNGVRIAPITDPSQRFWNVEDWYVRTEAQEEE